MGTSKDEKKVSAKGLRHLFSAIGRKMFSKVHRNEVEYGQTLSKKRRKNCILKSVSSLSYPIGEDGFLISSPYHINFKFSREENQNRGFRGSVNNFLKINGTEYCCDRCDCNLKKSDSLSRFSISSDSACDVSSSESSCDDLHCTYRKIPKRIKRKRSKSAGDASRRGGKTVENFIRIHSENFKTGIVNPTWVRNDAVDDDDYDDEVPGYESLTNSLERTRSVDDSDYDILVTKSNYRVAEPCYENLKVVQNLYESTSPKVCPEEKSERSREIVQSHKTYDEVIESLKILHLNSRRSEVENALNHCLEGYESLENDLNNDIQEFNC